MLPTGHRMRKGSEFALATRRGVRVSSKTIVVHFNMNGADADLETTKVGFVVPKSVGNAVKRNRTKRKLRHLMAKNLFAFPDPALVVVRALPASAKADSKALEQDLLYCLKKILKRNNFPQVSEETLQNKLSSTAGKVEREMK